MLTGKTAIVTGASRGIGKAIAGKLAALGANIAAIYAGNTSAAEKVCETYQNLYGIVCSMHHVYQSERMLFFIFTEWLRKSFNFGKDAPAPVFYHVFHILEINS